MDNLLDLADDIDNVQRRRSHRANFPDAGPDGVHQRADTAGVRHCLGGLGRSLGDADLDLRQCAVLCGELHEVVDQFAQLSDAASEVVPDFHVPQCTVWLLPPVTDTPATTLRMLMLSLMISFSDQGVPVGPPVDWPPCDAGPKLLTAPCPVTRWLWPPTTAVPAVRLPICVTCVMTCWMF